MEMNTSENTSGKEVNKTEFESREKTEYVPRKKRRKKLVSKYLSPVQLKGLVKTGDVCLPGDKRNMPKFSETTFVCEIDRMLDYMPADDREGLLFLFGLFAFLPKFVLAFIINLGKYNKHMPNFLGTPFRMIYVGVRGVFFTLYYSNLNDNHGYGAKIYDELKWDAKIVRHDMAEQGESMEGEKLIENPSSEKIEQLFETSRKARRTLKNLPIKQKVHYIRALKEVILERKEEIIEKVQSETKKSRTDALCSEIFGILDHLDFLEKNTHKVLKDTKVTTPIALMGKKSQVMFDPMGTVLIISPWNYPFYQAIVPITTSFMAGNATIYKPSEFTPLKGLVEDILDEAGFQREWVQVVYGDGKTGSELIDQRPDKIFFTGSVKTGQKIMAQASQYIIPVELELGGKDPMIVFEDADVQRAAAGAAWGAFTNTGQSCTSVERLYVHESIYAPFKEELLRITKGIQQRVDGDGNADIGEMTTMAQRDVVREHLDDARKKGATFLTGQEWNGDSMSIPPTILEDVHDDMLVLREETFGPVLPIVPFSDEGEAVALANDSRYGLSASVWTGDKKRAVRVVRSLETGNVSVNNVMLTEGNHHLPFGGTKYSGIGRYKGAFGLQNFCNVKSVLFDANANRIEANWYPYTKKKYQLFSGLTLGLFGKGLVSFAKFAINGLKIESYSDKIGKNGRS